MKESFLLKHKYRILAGIVLLSLWVYFPALQNGFTVDDYPAHVENEWVKGGVKNIPKLFKHNYYYGYDQRVEANEYRPLASSFYALQYSLFGKNNPKAMHGMSLLLSALTLVILYLLVSTLTSVSTGLVSTLLFAFMPVHSEAILNAKSQDDLLFTLLLIFSFWLWVKKGENRYLFIASILSFTLALFTKEAAIGAVLLFPLFDYLNGQKFKKATAWFIVPVAGYLWVRAIVLTPVIEGSVVNNALYYTDSFAVQSAMGFAFFLRYLAWMIYPPYLSWDYSFNHLELHAWLHWESITGFLLFAGGLAAMYLLFKKKHPLLWPLLLLYTGIGIYLQLFLKIDATFAERFAYYPSIGVAVLLAYFAGRVKFGYYALLLLTFVYSFTLHSRVGDWQDNKTLFLADIEKVPNSSRANSALAFVLYEEAVSSPEADMQALEMAAEYFRKAINIFGNDAFSWYNYGLCNLAMGDYTMAEICFKDALRINPNQTMAYNNLGNISYLKGEHEEAKLYYLKAISLDQSNPEAWSNLGAEYLLSNKNDSAFHALSIAIQLDPNNENAQYNHGIAKKRMGR